MPHVAGGLYAGRAVQRVDAQAGIIREDDDRIIAAIRSCLHAGTDGILGGSADEAASGSTVCANLRESPRSEGVRERVRLDQRILCKCAAIFHRIREEPGLFHGKNPDSRTICDLANLA